MLKVPSDISDEFDEFVTCEETIRAVGCAASRAIAVTLDRANIAKLMMNARNIVDSFYETVVHSLTFCLTPVLRLAHAPTIFLE